jgi:Zn-dependent peptidase ImmA (M78 family)
VTLARDSWAGIMPLFFNHSVSGTLALALESEMASKIAEKAEARASEVLEARWSSESETFRLPVDPAVIALDFGIEVYQQEMPDDVSAAIIKRSGKPAVIYIDKSDARVRQRFSCAHELGHYMETFIDLQADDEREFVDLRGPAARSGNDPHEVYANTFAASLLMPRDLFTKLSEVATTKADLCSAFDVSNSAVTNRLNVLGINSL